MSETENARWRPMLNWRSWSIPTKLGAIMLVPVIFLVGLSATQIRSQVNRADGYEHILKIIETVDLLEPLVAEIQAERRLSVEVLSSGGDPATVKPQMAKVDQALEKLTASFESNDFGAIPERRFDEASKALENLTALRQGTLSSQIDGPLVIKNYTLLNRSLLSLDRALNASLGDRRLSSNATALQEILVMMEEVRYQQAWVVLATEEGSLSQEGQTSIQTSRVRLTTKILEALSTTPEPWRTVLAQAVGGPAVTARNQWIGQMLANPDDTTSFTIGEWNARSDAVVALINENQAKLADVMRDTSVALQEDASNAAGRDSVILLSALLVAGAAGTTIARQLLGSLRQLRRSALDAAEQGLPGAVENIRLGRNTERELDPVPVNTVDEVGQVARAFDEVNRQALRLAIEQTRLRRGYSESFVGVSRRSQSLLERQLLLFEQLEQNEEDPDQLGTLFQLDHLATRMRRNNENLMVLSGSDLVRRFNQPTALTDVLQSAVSEIEHYPRVVVQPPPGVSLVGHAASDLVRLLAELFDNATNFSSPETSVAVSCAQSEDGSVAIDVLDRGIGIGAGDLAEANERLAYGDENDLATSRRMGLLVVAKLADRHDIAVRLHGGPEYEGVRASVHIPATIVVFAEDVGVPVVSGEVPVVSGEVPVVSGEVPVAYGEGAGSNGVPYLGFSEANGISAESTMSGTDLFEPLPAEQLNPPQFDIPQQPRNAVREPNWAWPSNEPDPPATPEQASAQLPEPGKTPWFQPADTDDQWPAETPGMDGRVGSAPAGSPPPAGSSQRSPAELSRLLAERYSGIRFGSDWNDEPASTGWNFAPAPENFGQTSGDFGQTPGNYGQTPGNYGQTPENFGHVAGDFASAPGNVDPAPTWNVETTGTRATTQAPSEYTAAGLPRRTPRAQLTLGSVADGQSTSGGGASRDPDRLRGRLADFQNGVQRGRHRALDEKGPQ